MVTLGHMCVCVCISMGILYTYLADSGQCNILVHHSHSISVVTSLEFKVLI